MGTCLTGVTPGEFNISLGKYSNWNSNVNTSHCNTVRYSYGCEIDVDDNKVGNITESADTKADSFSL